MRATLLPDPHRGPGYSVIEIHGAPPLGQSSLLLRRASDGAWLSGLGWRDSETSLTPDGWESAGDNGGEGAQRLILGPAITDNLDPGDAYTLAIPGAGSCALTLARLGQSRIIGGEAVGVTPPPVPGYRPDGPEMREFAPENTINEGVEPTPEVLGGPSDALSTGVVGAPAEVAEPTRRKRAGCGLVVFLLAIGWLGAGIALSHGAMRTPPATATATEAIGSAGDTPFSLCPGTRRGGERTSADEG